MLIPSFSPFPNLTTERLLLREMVAADAPGVLRLRSDKEVMKYINRPLALTIADAEAWIGVVISTLQKAEGITWCMAMREKPSEFIGSIGLWRIEKENYRAEIGYMLDPSFQGQGIMSEAIQKVVDYGFRQMKLHSIEGCIDPRNIPSAKVLEKSGFVREAYFKENYYLNGGFADTAVYSILTPYPSVLTIEDKKLEAEIVS
jgi:[ribosomal protein S5]-alanine N-acetyltransferase